MNPLVGKHMKTNENQWIPQWENEWKPMKANESLNGKTNDKRMKANEKPMNPLNGETYEN